MQKTYTFDTQGVINWQKTKKKRSYKWAKMVKTGEISKMAISFQDVGRKFFFDPFHVH